jgi:23S rRNA pseudouridine1911/1915/1917 synthase
VEAAIGRDPRNRLRMAVVDPQRHPGKPAATVVRRMQQAEAGCAVLCTLEDRAARTRSGVHMAHIGPSPGGGPRCTAGAPRGPAGQALHAFRLAFVHPVTGEALALHAPLPPDLRAAVGGLGACGYNESDWLASQHPRRQPDRPVPPGPARGAAPARATPRRPRNQP